MNTNINSVNILHQMKNALRDEQLKHPDPEICALIARDPTSLGILILLAAKVLGVLPSVLPSIACEDCQEDMASYADIEVEQGIKAAAQTYPDVWWHLWTCHRCSQTYHMTYALVEATYDGGISPLPVPVMNGYSPSPLILGWKEPPAKLPAKLAAKAHLVIIIAREILNTAFAGFTKPELALCRSGTESEEMVIMEEMEEMGETKYHLTVSIHPQQHDTWDIFAEVKPHPQGHVVLLFGDTEFRAPFDNGTATASVPAQLLIEPDGPPLHIGIEFDNTSE